MLVARNKITATAFPNDVNGCYDDLPLWMLLHRYGHLPFLLYQIIRLEK